MTGVLTEIPITADPQQTFACTLAGKRLFFSLFWNETTGRFTFDLTINDVPALAGRRIVGGVDLLAPFNFGIGELFAYNWDGKGGNPDLVTLPAGRWRLLHFGPEN